MKDKGIQLNDSSSGLESIDFKIDIIRDADGMITQGLVIGNTMPQNQALIIMASPGEFMFNPLIGVSIIDLLLDSDFLRIRHRIREHFLKDGMIVKSLEFEENKPLLIDAYYG